MSSFCSSLFLFVVFLSSALTARLAIGAMPNTSSQVTSTTINCLLCLLQWNCRHHSSLLHSWHSINRNTLCTNTTMKAYMIVHRGSSRLGTLGLILYKNDCPKTVASTVVPPIKGLPVIEISLHHTNLYDTRMRVYSSGWYSIYGESFSDEYFVFGKRYECKSIFHYLPGDTSSQWQALCLWTCRPFK